MLLPPFWRGRGKHAPARNRIARLQAILKAAQKIPGYREALETAKLNTPALAEAVREVDAAVAAIPPISMARYESFYVRRPAALRQGSANGETRSALMVSYAEARAGFANCHDRLTEQSDLYSPDAIAGATADLLNLSRALESAAAPIAAHGDQAMVVFSGTEAGILTQAQRDSLWYRYHAPLFEQFLGTDGVVIAAECEVHAGMHLRLESAIVESLDGEIVLTSLTDLETPALRVRTGLGGEIEHEACECGRVEPRLVGVRKVEAPEVRAAVA